MLLLACASVYVVASVLVFWRAAVVVVVFRSSVGTCVVVAVRQLALEAWGCVSALLLAFSKQQF